MSVKDKTKMAKEDYYKTLGVEKSASDDDIKKAYRRLAMKHHPDRNKNDEDAEARFKAIKEAYEVLSDPQKRQMYDQFGHAGIDPNARAAGAGGFGGGVNFSDIFGDVFSDIFGGGGGGRGGGPQAYRGADLRYNLELTLEEAVAGTTVKIRIPTLVNCEECNGSGAKKGTTPITCTTCGGHGQVRMEQGFFTVQKTCPACHGAGQVISDPCPSCRGKGRKEERKTLSVKVPAGVDTGDRIRLANEGEAGQNGGPPGDLYVHVHVKEHDIFKREENDLYCDVPISFVTAALGGEVKVPLIDGKVSLKIPAETQSGKLFRLRGKGVKSVRGHSTGDLYCRVMVETPVKLSAEQKEILEKFETSLGQGGTKHSPKATSWLDGVKKFFDGLKF